MCFSQGSVKGTSGVLRWTVGTQTDLVLSVMWSVPYNRQLWNTWVAIGLTNGTLGYDQVQKSAKVGFNLSALKDE